MVKMQSDLDPYQKDVLFLFCGKRTNRIKGLLWEGDGFLLLYKRLELGAFSWPRTEAELKLISKCHRIQHCRNGKGKPFESIQVLRTSAH